jgi:hypothetical protein
MSYNKFVHKRHLKSLQSIDLDYEELPLATKSRIMHRLNRDLSRLKFTAF